MKHVILFFHFLARHLTRVIRVCTFYLYKRVHSGPPWVPIQGTCTTPACTRFSLPVRVTFLIDGLNLHHSVLAAIRTFPNDNISQWLDVFSLCRANTHVIASKTTIHSVHFFFTFTSHLERAHPGLLEAHRTHIEALRATGVTIHLGRFKTGRIKCPTCNTKIIRREEKETDVAIATQLLESAMSRSCDTIVVVSGDTDLLPAIRTTKRLFPSVRIWTAFPFGRSNKDLAYISDGSFKFNYKQYATHKLPNEITLPNDTIIRKPESW